MRVSSGSQQVPLAAVTLEIGASTIGREELSDAGKLEVVVCLPILRIPTDRLRERALSVVIEERGGKGTRLGAAVVAATGPPLLLRAER